MLNPNRFNKFLFLLSCKFFLSKSFSDTQLTFYHYYSLINLLNFQSYVQQFFLSTMNSLKFIVPFWPFDIFHLEIVRNGFKNLILLLYIAF